MARVIVNFEVYIPPLIAPDIVPARNNRVKIGDGGNRFVVEIISAAFFPFTREIAWGNRHLITFRAYNHFKANAISIIAEGINCAVWFILVLLFIAFLQAIFPSVLGIF